jgi:hypothetical protein
MTLIREHIGDGVYASWDGAQFVLATDDVTCEIYLDNVVAVAFLRFVEKIKKEVAQ